MKPFLQFIGFTVLMLSGFVGFILLLNDKSWWSIPFFIVWGFVTILYNTLTMTKKCPTCNCKSKPTGIAGTSFMQWYCTKCSNTFWTDHWTWEYEQNINKK